MANKSLHESIGLVAKVSSPIVLGGEDMFSLTNGVSAYNHTIAIDGGYGSANISIAARRDEVEDWLDGGVGRDIKVVINKSRVWEGFVNSVSASLGGFTVTRGPLMNVANRVLVVYTPYSDITVDPPQRGDPTETTISEDEDSQARYGIQEEVVSGGTLIDAATYGGSGDQAVELRDAYLAEHKYLETSQELSIAEQAELSVTLDCLGYNAWLDRYVYNNAGTGYTWIPDKIQAVLSADPSGIFSTDYRYIADSAGYLLAVLESEVDNKKAQTVISEMVSLGDSADTRTTFGIYDDRVAHYSVIPSVIEYNHRIIQKQPQIEDVAGGVIYPWNVRPGKWLHVSDLLIGRHLPTELRLDPRSMLIESVSYTAPWGLRLTGNKVSTVKQLMAKRGFAL